jgi:nicotinate-nucleotide pyrophosphorylase (carboxylating)
MSLLDFDLDSLIHAALREDIGPGDITTSATVGASARCHAAVVAKQDGVLSGIDVFCRVFTLLGENSGNWTVSENGKAFKKGQEVASFTGATRAILAGERTALNLLQHLSGVATLTAKFAHAVAGLPVRIVDTRKTTPLLRALEKRAVVHGGGANHRFGLYDGILIKENHVTAAGGIAPAIAAARAAKHHLLRIEVETQALDEVREALDAKADAILLDNMDLETMRKAVALGSGHSVEFEASGNVTLERVRAIAETGVHYISSGALTHSAPAADFSLLVRHD